VNVIGVEQNVKQTRPFVINYSLLFYMHIAKENAFDFLLCYVLLRFNFFFVFSPQLYNQPNKIIEKWLLKLLR
jgi:hypothetical protein